MQASIDPAVSLLKKHVLSRLPIYGFRRYEHAVLPPLRLRTGGKHFRSDSDYYRSAALEADRLIRHLNVSESSRILDLGCGAGRLPIGLMIRNVEIARYHGIDVDAERIAWCQQHLERRDRRFTFEAIDVVNDRYNPKGEAPRADRLAFYNQSYDIIYLYSVFSHMKTPEMMVYLEAFAHCLAPGGSLFLTAFVEESVAECEENPAGYGDLEWKGPLHCVRFERRFFERQLRTRGFEIKRFDHRTETDGQSAYYLSRIIPS